MSTSAFAQAFATSAPAFRGAVHQLTKDPHHWAKQAKLDWEIVEGPALYKVDDKLHEYQTRKILYRSDNGEPLSCVSNKFKAVQPAMMLDFYKEAAEELGCTLELAGQAIGGRRIWAMAKTSHEMELKKGDKVGGYLLFVTGCDGGLSTQVMFTTVRLLCTNQLRRVIRNANKRGTMLARITHSTLYNHKLVKQGLAAIDQTWDAFEHDAKKLADKKVSKAEAQEFFLNVAYPTKTGLEFSELKETSSALKMLSVYEGGVGQKDIKGTAWGLLNAVTRYVDHETKARDGEARIARSWLGDGDRMKQRAFELALAL